MATMWKSKLCNSYEKAEIEKLHDDHHKMLKKWRSQNENRTCCDCGASENNWAVVNLGCFVCTRCASVHRGLGTHISKVKSCMGTYLWGPDEMEVMEEWGNARVNATYLAKYTGPAVVATSSDSTVRDFLQKKYGDAAWKGEPPAKAEKKMEAPRQKIRISAAPSAVSAPMPPASTAPSKPLDIFSDSAIPASSGTKKLDDEWDSFFADFENTTPATQTGGMPGIQTEGIGKGASPVTTVPTATTRSKAVPASAMPVGVVPQKAPVKQTGDDWFADW